MSLYSEPMKSVMDRLRLLEKIQGTVVESDCSGVAVTFTFLGREVRLEDRSGNCTYQVAGGAIVSMRNPLSSTPPTEANILAICRGILRMIQQSHTMEYQKRLSDIELGLSLLQ